MIQRSSKTRHRSQHYPASDQRIFVLILGIFLILRLIGLDSDYLWIDNLAQLSGGLEKIPWNAVLDTTIQETLTSTNPFFPMLMFRVLMNLFGPHTLILRIPAVVFACLSLYLLHRSLAKLFAHKAAVYLPQWLFAFSIPSILYSRQITQIIFYFLTTVIQLYLFITMVQTLSPDTSNHAIRRSIRIFAAISLLMLLFNWMSGLVYGLLLVSYTLLGLFRRPPQQSPIPRFALFCQEIIVVSIPIAILVYFRSRGGESVRSYLEAYYANRRPCGGFRCSPTIF